MQKAPAYYADGIPVFIGESYFAPGENMFIQMSTETPLMWASRTSTPS